MTILAAMNPVNNKQHEWEIGLSAWIIQDGNYGDFKTGQRSEFALEFYPHSVRPNDGRLKSAKHLGAAQYEIIGEIVYCTPDVWIVDFGINAFQESKPPKGMVASDFVAAEIYLGIDPYFYFERLSALPGMPPLIYRWEINSIGRQTAPFIESNNFRGQKIMIRDETKLGYETIGQTDAWHDDNGHAEYVLNCTRENALPRHVGKYTIKQNLK